MSGFVFLGCISTSFILLFLDFTSVNRAYKYFLFDCFFVILMIISGLKDPSTCFDTNNYVKIFESASLFSKYNYLTCHEPGYYYLNALVKFFGGNYHTFFIVQAVLILNIYRVLILRNTKYIFSALFVYVFCFYFLNEIIILRHGMASAFVFLMSYYIGSRKRKKAFVCFILACSFHFVAFFSAFLFLIPPTKRSLHFLFLLLPLALIVNDRSLIEIAAIISKVGNFESLSGALSKIRVYLRIENSAGIKRVVLYAPYLLFVWFVIRNRAIPCKEMESTVFYESSIMLVLSIYMMLIFNSIASFGRINALFLTSCIFLYPNITKVCRKKVYLIPVFLFMVLLNFYICIRQQVFNSGGSILKW